MDYQPADIIAIRGRGWLADHICAATRSEVSHLGLVISGAPVIVIEALLRVRTNPLVETLRNCERAWLIHCNTLSDAQRIQVVHAALKFSADDYGWPDLLLQLADATFRTRWFTETIGPRFLNDHPICSFVCAAPYGTLGYDFGVREASVSPGDVFTFAQAWPGEFTSRRIL